MKFLLDTNFCISVMRGNELAIHRLREQRADDCGVSMVTVFELFSGVERCRHPAAERIKVEMFLQPLHLLPFDWDSALLAAKIRWDLEKAGQKIGPYDLQIAAQALALRVILVTNNTVEFKRVRDLQLQDWILP